MTLPAFAAERRTAAPLLLGAGARRFRSMSAAHTTLSSKPAVHRISVERWDRQTDGRTDARPLRTPCFTYCAASINKPHLMLRTAMRLHEVPGGISCDLVMCCTAAPQSPVDLSVTALTWESVGLAWTPGHDGGRRQIFVVTVAADDDDDDDEQRLPAIELTTNSSVYNVTGIVQSAFTARRYDRV